MNLVHIHLMTNHIPVIGIVIGVAILAFAMVWRSADLKKFALIYFVALGLMTLVTYLTGEPAEEAIEHIAGISEAVIEEHEEASLAGLIAIELIAILSLSGLVFKKLNFVRNVMFWRVLLVLAIVASGTMGWIANLGGKIRHTEISEPQSNGIRETPNETQSKD